MTGPLGLDSSLDRPARLTGKRSGNDGAARRQPAYLVAGQVQRMNGVRGGWVVAAAAPLPCRGLAGEERISVAAAASLRPAAAMAARSWPDWSSRRLPLPVIAVPATAAPSPTASRTDKPRATPAARPPQNASPAPVLSATWTSIAGTCVIRPSARRYAPADPAFTTATRTPAAVR